MLGFSSYVNQEFPDVQAGFRKGRGTRDQTANNRWIIGNSRKISTSASLTMLKPLTMWITTNCGKFLEMEIPDHLTCLLRNLNAGQEATVRIGPGKTGSKLEKEYDNVTYCHLAYLNSMQSTSCEMPGWMKLKLESSC